jgi:hypothetical protein
MAAVTPCCSNSQAIRNASVSHYGAAMISTPIGI